MGGTAYPNDVEKSESNLSGVTFTMHNKLEVKA